MNRYLEKIAASKNNKPLAREEYDAIRSKLIRGILVAGIGGGVGGGLIGGPLPQRIIRELH